MQFSVLQVDLLVLDQEDIAPLFFSWKTHTPTGNIQFLLNGQNLFPSIPWNLKNSHLFECCAQRDKIRTKLTFWAAINWIQINKNSQRKVKRKEYQPFYKRKSPVHWDLLIWHPFRSYHRPVRCCTPHYNDEYLFPEKTKTTNIAKLSFLY